MKRLVPVAFVVAAFAAPALADGEEGVRALVDQYAAKHGVPRRIAHGVVRVESGYRCHARNRRSSAKGIMQVIDGTARGVGVHGNRFDCRTGLEAGMRYLAEALNKGGAGCAGVSLYNLGTAARPRCTAYGLKVLGGQS